jgi:hypothetical protein
LKGGSKQKQFIDDLREDDPDAAAHFAANQSEIKEPPEPIFEYLLCYWQAWQSLKDDRPIDGFGGVGRIYYQALSQYARDTGFNGEELPLFMTMLRSLDSEYIAWVIEERPKADANTKKD